MTEISTADRVVVSVTATDSGDWQVVSVPTGFQGVVATLFAENDYLHGFVRHEDGEQWEVYDCDDADNTKLLQITSISGTITLARPATPFDSSQSDGSRMAAGTGTHTLALSEGAGTLRRIFRELNPFWKTLTSGDATPAVGNYRWLKAQGSTTITRFDELKSGSFFIVKRGASDITIAHDGTNIELFNAENLTLTAVNPVAGFAIEGTKVVQIFGFNAPLDEDDFASDSATRPPSQQSVKAYVDAVARGLGPKQAVKCATTANITLSGGQTIDGISVTTGDRVLVKNQTAPAENGIYVVAVGSWARAVDMDAWAEVPSAYVMVMQGSTQADTGWVCTSDAGGTLGTTAITFVQFSGASSYVQDALVAGNTTQAPSQAIVYNSVRYDVRAYGAVPGNAASLNAALDAIYALMGTKGGLVYLPACEIGTPWTCSAAKISQIFADTSATTSEPTSRVELVGDGYGTWLQPSGSATDFITIEGAWAAVRNIFIKDTAGLISGSYINRKPKSGTLPTYTFETHIECVKVIGKGADSTATFIKNDGGRNLVVNNCFAWNVEKVHYNKANGVNNRINGLYGTGVKYGIHIGVYDAGSGQPEGAIYSNCTFECTVAGGRGVWVQSGISLVFDRIVMVQFTGGSAYAVELDGTTSSINTIWFNDCEYEGSPNNPSFKSRGNVNGLIVRGGMFGTGGYSGSDSNLITGFDWQDVVNFTIEDFSVFYPVGNMRQVAKFVGCYGTVGRGCNRWNLVQVANSSDTTGAVRWEIYFGLPTTRNTNDEYPRGDWCPFVPVVSNRVAGTITTVPVSDYTDSRYRRDGKTVTVNFKFTLGSHSGGTTLYLAPPTRPKSYTNVTAQNANGAGGPFPLYGLLDITVTSAGAGFPGAVGLTKHDNTYSGAVGDIIVGQFTYEEY